MKTMYFNNAGAGILSEATFNIVVDHMRLEMEFGAYKAANMQSERVQDFYKNAAELLNAANKEEIAFIDSASRGWNLVMYGLNITDKDTIVTLESEYGTNLLTVYDIAKNTGCSVEVVKCKDDGTADIKAVEYALQNGGTVLALSHVAAQGSIVNPVVELGDLAAKYGVIYIVDGCQAVGQLKVDVQAIQCHAYMAAGRKWLRGPRGTGILYVRADAPIRTPQIDLASADLVFDDHRTVVDVQIRRDAKQFELWEKSTASLLGLSNAIREYLDYGVDTVTSKIVAKANKIRECIWSNSNIELVGSRNALVGTAGFYVHDASCEDRVKELFDSQGFVISAMCDWDCPISFPQNGVRYIFRVSPHYYTPDEDIDAVCELIKSI